MVCIGHRLLCTTPHFPKHKFPVHATRNVQMQLKSTVPAPYLSLSVQVFFPRCTTRFSQARVETDHTVHSLVCHMTGTHGELGLSLLGEGGGREGGEGREGGREGGREEGGREGREGGREEGGRGGREGGREGGGRGGEGGREPL